MSFAKGTEPTYPHPSPTYPPNHLPVTHHTNHPPHHPPTHPPNPTQRRHPLQIQNTRPNTYPKPCVSSHVGELPSDCILLAWVASKATGSSAANRAGLVMPFRTPTCSTSRTSAVFHKYCYNCRCSFAHLSQAFDGVSRWLKGLPEELLDFFCPVIYSRHSSGTTRKMPVNVLALQTAVLRLCKESREKDPRSHAFKPHTLDKTTPWWSEYSSTVRNRPPAGLSFLPLDATKACACTIPQSSVCSPWLSLIS